MSNQIDSPKDPVLADSGRFPGDFHSVAKQSPFRIAFRLDFGLQNGPKINEISSFGALCFASAFWDAKLMNFGGLQGWKPLNLLRKSKVFRKIYFTRLGRFSVDSRGQKYIEIHQNSLPNAIIFSTSFSKRIFMIFSSNLEPKNPSTF